MLRKTWFWVAALAVGIYIIFHKKINKVASDVITKVQSYWTVLSDVITKHEGFSSKPYWDYKQWSWGYGLLVPDSVADKNVVPQKTIDKPTALLGALGRVQKDEAVLRPLVKVELNANQWAALLDFSYGNGVGSAKKLLPNINAGKTDALIAQMRKYVNVTVDGKLTPLKALKDRREVEVALWLKP